MRDAETFTVDDPRFSTAQVVGPSMLSLDGAEHERHRSPFARPFRLDAVRERFTSLVEVECDRLLDAIAPDGEADLRETLSGPLSVSVMAAALGLDDLPADVPLGWYRGIVAAVTDITAGVEPTGEGRTAFGELAARARAGARPRAGDDPPRRLRPRRRRPRSARRSSRMRPCCCSAGSRRPTA